MTRYLVAACLALTLGAGQAAAEEKPLTGAEIERVLSGNTAVATYREQRYQQYFAPDGTSTVVHGRRAPDVGRWKVTDDGKYCAQGGQGGWSCYTMTGEGKWVTWLPEDGGAPFPARMVTGNMLE